MSNTFSLVIEQAEEEWRLIFAGMVREYFDSNVLPPPLNLLEIPINACMRSRMKAKRSLYHADGHKMPRWGQHYLFPVPSLRWHLPMAMASFLATSKDPGDRGIRHIIGQLDKLTPTMSQGESYSMPSDEAGTNDGDTSSSKPGDTPSSALGMRETLTALRHDFVAELQPLRHDAESAMASIASLTMKVARMDEKLSSMFKNSTVDSDIDDDGIVGGKGIKLENCTLPPLSQTVPGLPKQRVNDAPVVDEPDSRIHCMQDGAVTDVELAKLSGSGEVDTKGLTLLPPPDLPGQRANDGGE